MTQQSNGSNLLVQGRIVWGMGSSLFEGKAKTDYNTGQPVMDAQGNPVVEYGFGLAIPKNTEVFNQVWQTLHSEAYTIYPSGQLPPDFAMKFKDGDGVDHNGKPYGDREGYAGHIILSCTTQIPIKYFKFEGGNNILVNDGVKVGDYVNVQLNVKAHPPKGRGKAGLYLNPSAVQLIQAGPAIVNAPSGDQVFGTSMPSFQGQMLQDAAPAMPNVGQPAAPAMPNAAPAQPAAPAMPNAAPAANPHYGVIPETHQPQGNVAQAAPMQAAPSVHGGMNNVQGTPAQPVTTGMTPPMPGMPQQ